MIGGLGFWQRGYWAERRRVRARRRARPRPTRANRELAPPRAAAWKPAQVTSLWDDGRTRVTDYAPDGRKVRVHETRVRGRDRDGQRPRQARASAVTR